MRMKLGLLAAVVLVACQDRGTAPANEPVVTAPPSAITHEEPTPVRPDSGVPAGGDQASEEACVDAWLAKNKLDAYGSAEGTMYAGGSPLFDERTGESKNRLEFVYARHPAAQKACRAAAP